VRPGKTDGNFGNVSAGVLFSEVAYQRKRWWVSAQILSCKNCEQICADSQIGGKVFLLQFDWFDCKQSLWYDWSIACTDKQRERNVVRKKAAVSGDERCVTSLKTAAKETSSGFKNEEYTHFFVFIDCGLREKKITQSWSGILKFSQNLLCHQRNLVLQYCAFVVRYKCMRFEHPAISVY